MSLEFFKDRIEYIIAEDLIPNPQNPRKHSAEQIHALGQSIKKHGIYRPVLIDEDNIILAGHGLVLAASKKDTLPCVRFDNLSEDEKTALMIADNAIADMGETDSDLLKALLNSNPDILGNLDNLGINFDTISEDIINNSKEIEPKDYDRNYNHKCPKCGFEYE